MDVTHESPSLFRVWIARFDNWRPTRWQETPPQAQAIEPAVPGCLTWEEAAQFVAGFNETTLADGAKLWAMAVPVVPRYEGDLAPGESIAAPSPFAVGFEPSRGR